MANTLAGAWRACRRLIGYNHGATQYQKLRWDGDHEDSGDDAGCPDDAKSEPHLFYISPLQLWLGPLIRNVNQTGAIETNGLPYFSRSSIYLNRLLGPSLQLAHSSKNDDGIVIKPAITHLLFQWEVGGMMLASGALEMINCVATLGCPLILNLLLKSPDRLDLALGLVSASLIVTVCGRSKDQICRVQALWLEGMLRSRIFEKSLVLTPAARIKHPPARIISINAVDVDFMTNYVAKIHDVWSAPLQIVGIAIFTTGIMGWSAVWGFLVVALIFVGQAQAGKGMRTSMKGYVSRNDQRLGLFRDFLNNVKSVKAVAVERLFRSDIETCRSNQLASLRYYLWTAFAIFTAVNQITPYLAASVAFFALYLAQDGEKDSALTPEVVFPCMVYFNLLYQPVTQASLAISRQYAVIPSLHRIVSFLQAPESRNGSYPDSSEGDINDHYSIIFKSATYTHASSNTNSKSARLEIGDLTIPSGQITTVLGPNGGGKTSFLLSILGELSPLSSDNPCHTVHGSLAYSAQEPWLLSGSLRDNIVFNAAGGYDKDKYQRVISQCCLDRDFQAMPGGVEHAQVGEAGKNLSGGQRARVSLARAIYSDADILLLDDPFSAVDEATGRMLFESIKSLNKTVVLVTLHAFFAHQADNIVVIDNNKKQWAGPKQDFFEQPWRSKYLQTTAHVHTQPDSDLGTDRKGMINPQQGQDVPSKLIEDEERAEGALAWGVTKFYVAMSGGARQASIVIIMALTLCSCKVLSHYWFVWWIDGSLALEQSQYVGCYLAITIFQGFITGAMGIILAAGSLRASRSVHETVVGNILSAPLAYFDGQPTGRLLNRLSKDMESLDSKIMNALDGFIGAGSSTMASVIIVSASGPLLFLTVLPFILIVGWCVQRFRVTARQVQRLSAVLQSPALSLLSEAQIAPCSVRAYGAVSFLVQRHARSLDVLLAAKTVRRSLDTWVTFRAELAAIFTLLCISLLMTLTGESKRHASQAGLALSIASTLAKHVYMQAWCATDVEIQMNSVERLMAYHDDMPCEAGDGKSGDEVGHENSLLVPYGWPPANLDIELRGVSLRYPTWPTPALDNIHLSIRQGEKVGIAGRTGSGKSSLLSVLARLVNPNSGTVLIGGTDIAQVNPQEFRRSTVITLPQEPLIFEGSSLRRNLDPSVDEKHGGDDDEDRDARIFAALEACQMRRPLLERYGEWVLGREIGGHGGIELSGGEKQLLCAARVLIQRPRVLLVDEASANVDYASDAALQRTWQSLPRSTTMIAVAHRMSSLAWMDRVIVMDQGRIVRDGRPDRLQG